MAETPTNAACQLQTTQSSRSTAALVFVTSSSPGQLDPVGLTPAAKVHVRPGSSLRPKKPSALDKHLRHVVLLQRSNRHRAQQSEAAAQHKHKHRQNFAGWCHRLRSSILSSSTASAADAKGTEPCSAGHNNSPAQLATGPAEAPTVTQPTCSSLDQQQQQDAEILQAWKPVAAAAQVRELQQALSMQQRQLQASLPTVLDPDTLRPDYRASQQKQQHTKPARRTAYMPAPTPAVATHAEATCELDDVDAFLDDLLCTAEVAASTYKTPAPNMAPTAHTSSQQPASHTLKQQQGQQQHRPSSSKGKHHPAWALSEQQQAASEAAAAESEEQQLLEFAEQLDLQELLQDLGDEELAAAFKELELAEAAVSESTPDADKRWQHCFVTALNATAMRGIAASNTAAAAAAGSQQGDQRSSLSSASAIRKAEAAAARRQRLLTRLQRLMGNPTTTNSFAAATPAGAPAAHLPASAAPPSLCGSSSSPAGFAAGGSSAARAAAAAGCGAESWDSSTVAGSSSDEVRWVKAAVKHLEAGEVLAENPEMKGVHSTASVRSMLSKLEGAAM